VIFYIQTFFNFDIIHSKITKKEKNFFHFVSAPYTLEDLNFKLQTLITHHQQQQVDTSGSSNENTIGSTDTSLDPNVNAIQLPSDPQQKPVATEEKMRIRPHGFDFNDLREVWGRFEIEIIIFYIFFSLVSKYYNNR